MNTQNKVKVFLVDDDNIFTKSLQHALSEPKTEIKTFPTGEDCLKTIKKDEPEVVVLDYYLNSNDSKAMNGIQILNKIKKINPGTEVIMLSSQDNVSVALDTLKYGAYDYIPKGQSAFVKIRNDIRHIHDTHEQTEDFNKETTRLKWTNVFIVLLIIIIYLLNRLI